MPVNNTPRPIRAFVQLSHGYGAATWHDRWKQGRILGLNEEYAYGYLRGSTPGFVITQSEDAREGLIGRAVRYAARLILGFDFVHVWRNRRSIFESDVVWTHTESQSMAVQLLLRLYPGRRRPGTIGQSVWLIDRWGRESWKNRLVFRWLLSGVDILTFLSPCNAADAAKLFPGKRVELVEFGIRADEMVTRPAAPAHEPVNVLSLGNDRHRDWDTLLKATADMPCRLTIGTTDPAARRKIAAWPHARLATLSNNTELFALYDQADVVVVPVGPNRHASGITAIEEAVARGVAVITTDAGGLRHYFADDAVCYVPVGDAAAMGRAIQELAADAGRRAAMLARAQARMRDCLNSRAYVARHVALSYEIMPAPARSAAPFPAAVARGPQHPAHPEAGAI